MGEKISGLMPALQINYSPIPKINMRKTIKLVKVIVLTILLLSVVKIVVVNLIVTNGMEISQIESRAMVIAKENRLLNERITRLSSIRRISEEALGMGYVSTISMVNLSSEIPIAAR
jgi:hypothetical protein